MSLVRVAVMGGSFNPVHKGHIAVAREVLKQGLADEVWLLVSPQNPLKAHTDLLDEKVRYRLTCQALSDEAHIEASDFEFALPRPSYTWLTLDKLIRRFPQVRFSLLIGADNWCLFDRWAHTDYILRNFPLIIYPREGYPVRVDSLPPSVHLLTGVPAFPFSSTDIRRAVADGRPVADMVPSAIVTEVERLYASSTPQAALDW